MAHDRRSSLRAPAAPTRVCGALTVPSSPTGERDAAAIAIAALSHFATDTRILDRFFALTGLDPAALREVAGTRSFTAGVLDFVLSDERLVIAVAEAQEIPPEAIADARRSLERKTPRGSDRPLAVEDDWPPRVADDYA
jgi:hypothetical protein